MLYNKSVAQSHARRDEKRRRKSLKEDLEIQAVEPHRVFCRKCHQWVMLHQGERYCLSHWRKHKSSSKHRDGHTHDVPLGNTLFNEHVHQTYQPPSSLHVSFGPFHSDPFPLSTPSQANAEKPASDPPMLLNDFDGVSSSSQVDLMRQLSITPVVSHISDSLPSQSQTDTSIDSTNTPLFSSPSPDAEHAETSVTPSGLPQPPACRREDARRMALEQNPEVANVEPFKILCRLCNQWVVLSREVKYCSSNWNLHISSNRHINHRDHGLLPGDDPDEEDSLTGQHPRVPVTRRSLTQSLLAQTDAILARRPTAFNKTDRYMLLDRDPESAAVEPQRVLCRLCHRWVRLGPGGAYGLQRWESHKLTVKHKRQRRSAASQSNPSGNKSAAPTKQHCRARKSLSLLRAEVVNDTRILPPSTSVFSRNSTVPINNIRHMFTASIPGQQSVRFTLASPSSREWDTSEPTSRCPRRDLVDIGVSTDSCGVTSVQGREYFFARIWSIIKEVCVI